jgi:YVTN family beta-propeller protein
MEAVTHIAAGADDLVDGKRREPTVFALLVKMLLLGLGLTCVAIFFGARAADAQSISYVTNCDSNNISVIYSATHEIKSAPVRSVIPNIAGTKCPDAVAFTPYRIEGNANGQFAYVTNKGDGIANSSVTVIDTAKGKTIKKIDVGVNPLSVTISAVCQNPVGGACNANNELQGVFVYVVNGGNGSSNHGSVSIIDANPLGASFNTVVKTIAFNCAESGNPASNCVNGLGSGPTAAAISQPILEPIPGGNGMRYTNTFYVHVTASDNKVYVIDAVPGSGSFHTVLGGETIDIGAKGCRKPVALAYNRDSDWDYVVCTDPNPGAPASEASNGTVIPIDTRCPDPAAQGTGPVPVSSCSPTARNPIYVGQKPLGIGITHDFTGSSPCKNFRAYVSNSASSTFSVIDVESGHEPGQPPGNQASCLNPITGDNPNFQKYDSPGDKSRTFGAPATGLKPAAVTVIFPDEDFVYMTLAGSNGVVVIDSDPDSNPAQYNFEVGRVTNKPITNYSECPTVCAIRRNPIGIANTPRIPYAYVMNNGVSTGSIDVVGASPQIGDKHPRLARIGFTWRPSWVALHRNQDYIYILDEANRQLRRFNTIALFVDKSSPVLPAAPVGVAMPPDGAWVYVSLANGQIYPIDIETMALGPPVDFKGHVCSTPKMMSVHPDNFYMYVACPVENRVVVVDTHEDLEGGGDHRPQACGGVPCAGVSVPNPDGTFNQVIKEINLPGGKCGRTAAAHPFGMQVSHDGSRLFVMNTQDGTVTVLSTAEGSANYHKCAYNDLNLGAGTGPLSAAFSEDDITAYVTNSTSNTVSPIRVSNGFQYAKVVVGSHPQDVFINLGERTAAYVTVKDSNELVIINTQPGDNGLPANVIVPNGHVGVGPKPIGLILTEP